MLFGWAAFFFNPGAYEANPFHGEALGPVAPSWAFATAASLIAILSLMVRWPRVSAASLITSTGWWALMGVAAFVADPEVILWLLYIGIAWLLGSEWISLDLVRGRE